MRDLGLAPEPWKTILEITVALAVPWRYGEVHPPDPSGLDRWPRLDSPGGGRPESAPLGPEPVGAFRPGLGS